MRQPDRPTPPFTRLLLTLVLTVAAGPSSESIRATVYIDGSVESKPCDSQISDENIRGQLWDTGVPGTEVLAVATVKCAPLKPPAGTHYVEWNVPAEAPGSADGIGPEVFPAASATNLTLVTGRTYYLASFWRFQRIDGKDIWHDTVSPEPPYSFDKLLEMRGPGFRWGISVGYNGNCTIGADHRFTADAWYAQSVLGVHGSDHLVANQNGFSASHPPFLDYEKWHALVLGITAQNHDAGRVELCVNGLKLTDQPHYTMEKDASLDRIILNGTVAQPSHDAPAHLRQVERPLLTDDWQDVVRGGYLKPPD